MVNGTLDHSIPMPLEFSWDVPLDRAPMPAAPIRFCRKDYQML